MLSEAKFQFQIDYQQTLQKGKLKLKAIAKVFTFISAI